MMKAGKSFLLAAVLPALLILCLAAGAAGEEETAETLAEKAVRVAADGEDLIRMGAEDLYDIVGIEEGTYTDFAYLADYDALSGREIILVCAVDEEAAEEIGELLNLYRETRMKNARNYQPEVYRAWEETEVFRSGLLVGLCAGAADPLEEQRLLTEE